jgi:N-acetylmuramoyl-L-alanine amidase
MRARLLLAVVLLASCGAPRTTVPVTAPAPTPAPLPVAVKAAPLPAMPVVDGPLAIKVVYPQAGQTVTSRDSNFIFGSIGSGRASLLINGHAARVYPNGAFIAFIPNPAGPSPRYELVAERGGESVRATHSINYPAVRPPAPASTPPAAVKPEALATSRADTLAALKSSLEARMDSLHRALTRDEPIGWVRLGTASAAADTDRTIIARPIPGGTYKWFFMPGTVVPLVAREEGFARVRLDRNLDVYVDTADARYVSSTFAPERRVTTEMRLVPNAEGTDLVIPVGERPPYFVEETEHSIVLTLYGVKANTDLVNYASADSLVRNVEWEQLADERARVTVNLRSAPYGYLVLWERSSLVLKLRARPRIDPRAPLHGLTIAVDPGHPPIGATGPTGLWEPTVTLPVGMRLKAILEERGARVVMTRTTPAPVALGDRPIIARRANANAFVSIHLNAYPDGVNPFVAPGTGTYFFRSQSEPLARAVQRGMVGQMGLQDLGVNYSNLAVVRSTWYPAVLCEGAFIMMPDQEFALRTPEFQERYARGIADGLESYFRSLGAR